MRVHVSCCEKRRSFEALRVSAPLPVHLQLTLHNTSPLSRSPPPFSIPQALRAVESELPFSSVRSVSTSSLREESRFRRRNSFAIMITRGLALLLFASVCRGFVPDCDKFDASTLDSNNEAHYCRYMIDSGKPPKEGEVCLAHPEVLSLFSFHCLLSSVTAQRFSVAVLPYALFVWSA